MLFNSYTFIFLYLPLVLLVFFQLGRISHNYAAAWLALASLFFYGYWNPAYVGLLLGSIVCNYEFGLWIAKAGLRIHAARAFPAQLSPQGASQGATEINLLLLNEGSDAPSCCVKDSGFRKKHLLFVAIAANLLLLAYYKYANFFVGNLNPLLGTNWNVVNVILPLGISFFTFTQIAFLVDTYQGKVKEYNFIHYLLFVTYFPHLIAGPVLHHKEMMPQFARATTYRFSFDHMSVGLTIFFIGLFKKVILADNIAYYVPSVFDAPSAGVQLTFIEAWGGALCYTLQLYFDFSGYSDMAIGLSRMFGVTLPLNFHSPYKSVNIIEFWRHWHMTLSRFLRDYLYIPLGGNRHGTPRRYLNLMTTMLLGGLWHGAGWTFVIWGGLHGLYLAINHAWHALRRILGQDLAAPLSWPAHALSVLLTFASVTIAWVFFRASDLHTAATLVQTMLGLNGFALPDNGIAGKGMINWIAILLLIVWLAPNTQTIMQAFNPALDAPRTQTRLAWRASGINAWVLGLMAGVTLLCLTNTTEFIYHQF